MTDGKKLYCVFSDGTVVAVDFQGEVVWKNSNVEFHSLHGLGASPLLVGDQLTMPFDGSSAEEKTVGWKIPWDSAVLLSLDTATGDVCWKGSRGKSRVGHVTPILVDNDKQVVSAGGRIYILSEEGVTLTLRPGAKYDEIARNEIDEKCMASMAVSQGQFFIRTAENLYCIGAADR